MTLHRSLIPYQQLLHSVAVSPLAGYLEETSTHEPAAASRYLTASLDVASCHGHRKTLIDGATVSILDSPLRLTEKGACAGTGFATHDIKWLPLATVKIKIHQQR